MRIGQGGYKGSFEIEINIAHRSSFRLSQYCMFATLTDQLSCAFSESERCKHKRCSTGRPCRKLRNSCFLLKHLDLDLWTDATSDTLLTQFVIENVETRIEVDAIVLQEVDIWGIIDTISCEAASDHLAAIRIVIDIRAFVVSRPYLAARVLVHISYIDGAASRDLAELFLPAELVKEFSREIDIALLAEVISDWANNGLIGFDTISCKSLGFYAVDELNVRLVNVLVLGLLGFELSLKNYEEWICQVAVFPESVWAF